MNKFRIAPIALLSSALWLSSVSVAYAEPTRTEQATKLSDEATELFKAHDYAKANEKYAQAYVLDPDPNLLYNQARCYEAAGDRPAADAKYKEFLTKPGGDQNAQKRAKAFTEEFARNPAGISVAPAQPSPTAQPAPVAGQPTQPAGVAATSDADSSGKTLRTVGFVAAGVGAVSLVVGTVFGLSASSKNSDAEKQCTGNLCTQEGLTLTDEARSAATVSTIAFVAGGVLVVGGLGLALFGPKASSGGSTTSSSTSAWLSPAVSPTFAGVRVGGGF